MSDRTASRVIDISTPLDERTPWYPGDSRFERRIVSSMKDGAGYNLSALSMSAHSGTHLDAPLHFIADGASIDQIAVERLVSEALLADFNGKDSIGVDELAALPLREGVSLLLCANTHMRSNPGERSACTLTRDGARYLVDRRINVVAIDWLSIESDDDPSYPVHHILLSHDILICEGLRLAGVADGWYTLLLAPLLITGGDGAPVRALLLR